MQVEFENKSKSHQPQTFLAGQTQKELKEHVCVQGGKTKVASLTSLASTLLAIGNSFASILIVYDSI